MIDYVVTLVHGTFAQGANWIQDEALLPSELRKLGEARLLTFPFSWSGKNTHEARGAAGRELAKCLLERVKQYPSARQAIIAHSHAGNIALYAARASLIPDLRIVTLGTPFIQTESRRIEKVLAMCIGAVTIILSLALGIAGIALLASFVNFHNEFGEGRRNVGGLPIALACMLYVLLLAWLCVKLPGIRSGFTITKAGSS